MGEYRAIRARHTLLEICRQPELATEVTLQPVRAFPIDAAILFADILLPLEPMGVKFDFAKGEGPVFEHPIRRLDDIEELQVIEPRESLAHVLEAIRLVRRELDGEGAAHRVLRGGALHPRQLPQSRGGGVMTQSRTRLMMLREPELWHMLAGKLAEVVSRFLLAQIEAGAQAVQLFDSWVGALSENDYATFVKPHVRALLEPVLATGVPVIHFGTGTAMLLELMRDAGGTVIGVDWRVPLDVARARLGTSVAIQGNLDPVLLQAPIDLLERRTPRDGASRRD